MSSVITHKDGVILFEEQLDAGSDIRQKIIEKYGKRAEIIAQEPMKKSFFNFLSPQKTKVIGCINKQSNVAGREDNETFIDALIEELKYLHKKIDTNVISSIAVHKGMSHAMSIMHRNQFSDKMVSKFREMMERTCVLEMLENPQDMEEKLIRYLCGRISIYATKTSGARKQRTLCLIGPTGVGKTTAMGKLSHIININRGGKEKNTTLRLASLDYVRLGAMNNIEVLGRLLNADVMANGTPEEFAAYVQKGARPSLLVVDTTSINPHDDIREDYIGYFDKIAHDAEIFLVIAANTNVNDIDFIFEKFGKIQFKGVIITKLDEACMSGAVIGKCIEHTLPVAYLGNGREMTSQFIAASYRSIFNFINGFSDDLKDRIIEEYMNG